VKLEKISITMLWFAAAFDPIGKFFYLRYIALTLTWLIIISQYILGRKISSVGAYQIALILSMLIVMPGYGFIVYMLHASDAQFTDTSYIAAGVLIFTTLIYSSKNLCDYGVNSMVFVGRLLAAVIVLAFLSQSILTDQWLSFLVEKDVALIGNREYGGATTPYIYFLASPMLVFVMAYDYSKILRKVSFQSVLWFALASGGLFLSGTRAHILISIFFIPIYHAVTGGLKAFYSLLAVVLMFVSLASFNDDLRKIVGDFFSVSEANNQSKIYLLSGYNDIVSDPVSLIFGQGYNAHSWSSEMSEMISAQVGGTRTELTYLEVIRVYGVIIGGAYFIVLFKMLKQMTRLPDVYLWIFPGILFVLINSALNPYLFSTNGCLPLALGIAVLNFGKSPHLNHPLHAPPGSPFKK
jgi:hypothetical protein